MKDLLIVNLILAIFFTVCYTYQFIYILIALIKEPKKYTSDNRNRYAVIISARNERDVIHNLIDSIKKQNYPAELDVYKRQVLSVHNHEVFVRVGGHILFVLR